MERVGEGGKGTSLVVASELQKLAATGMASAREQAQQTLAAAERARERARSLFSSSGGLMSSFWSDGRSR